MILPFNSATGTSLGNVGTSYYDDRLKEVPNRPLERWAAARAQNGLLTLEELVEIAQLPDAQLQGADMAEGARECYGLAEWDLIRNHLVLPNLRYLAGFTPGQRQEAMSPTGLLFSRIRYSRVPTFTVPVGRIRFCRFSAFEISVADNPFP